MKLYFLDGCFKDEKLEPVSLPKTLHHYCDNTLFSNTISYREELGVLMRGECTEPQDLIEKVDACNAVAGTEEFGVFLDMGVCYLAGQDVYEVIEALGTRIKVLIVRENNGVQSRPFMPFTGPHLDYERLIRLLRRIGFDDVLVLDISMIRGYDWLQMRKLLEHTVVKMGQYIAWQIQIEPTLAKYSKRVLFGAGQMCKNYMDYYGQKYPVLFTCDNNQNRWGQTFEGLEIRSPEALKDLPEDCAIFLCNMYYDEVERQLRDMGIQNPIERFNDELLPEEPLR